VRILGGLQSGEAMPTAELTEAANSLNAMVKRWQASDDIKLWKTADCILYLTKDQSVYEIGGSTAADNASYERITDIGVKTEVATAHVSGTTTLVVDSITNVAASDKVGLVQDDGTIHWTTANGAPSGSTITMTDVSTDDAAVDNHVYAYTTDLPRPLRIIAARRRNKSGQDIPIEMFSRREYQDLPNKTDAGSPTQMYYNPQLNFGYVYLWPAPDTVNDRIVFTAYLPIHDFDAAGDTPDFPQEWYDALTFGLAANLAQEYGVTGGEKMEIVQQAKAYLDDAVDWDNEITPVFFTPEIRNY
jgi:hypothetical protein